MVHPSVDATRELARRARRFVRAQAAAVHPRLWLAQSLVRALPDDAFGTMRSRLYRAAGFSGIARTTAFHGPADFRGSGDIFSRLHVGRGCTLNHPLVLDLNATIHIGENVGVGSHVVLLTSGHLIGGPDERRGPVSALPIHIGRGAWLGAGVLVLPGVTIGPGAVIGAGSVVVEDIPPHTLAAGTPARPIRPLLSRRAA